MDEQNPYVRLGVERDADARAIKKAYVGLIRQFPPETHPEEFQSIRAAYELLSDPEARAAFDLAQKAYEALPEIEAQALRTAHDLLRRGLDREAEEVCQALLLKCPASVQGSLLLGRLLLGRGELRGAEQVYSTLLQQNPDQLEALTTLAQLRMRRNAPAEALPLLRRAAMLRPELADLHFLLARCCVQMTDRAAALNSLEGARKGAVTADQRLRILEMELYICLKLPVPASLHPPHAEAAHRTGHQVLHDYLSLARSADEVFLQYASEVLAGLAARLFHENRSAAANLVLEGCGKLQPHRVLYHPLRPQYRLAWDQVPKELWQWLATQTPKDRWVGPGLGPHYRRWAWGLAMLAGFVFLVHRVIVAEATPLDIMLLLSMVYAGMAAMVGSFTKDGLHPPPTVVFHPFYLIEVKREGLALWPWFWLVPGELPGTVFPTLMLTFGEFFAHLSFPSHAEASAFLKGVRQWRPRLLHALAEGSLHEIPGIQVAPPRALPEEPSPPRRSYGWPIYTLPAILGLIWIVGMGGDSSLRPVVVEDDPFSYRDWLGDHRSEPERHLVKARLDQLVEERKALFLDLVDVAHPGTAALLAAAEAQKSPPTLPLHGQELVPTVVQELQAVLSLYGGYLQVVGAPKRSVPTARLSSVILIRQENGVVIQIYVEKNIRFEHVLEGDRPGPGQVLEALGLGSIPAPERWKLLSPVDRNPYPPAAAPDSVAAGEEAQ